MWHIMLCGLLALPACVELDRRQKGAEMGLTERNGDACATRAKCAKTHGNDGPKRDDCAPEGAKTTDCGSARQTCLHVGLVVGRSTGRLRSAAPAARQRRWIRWQR